MLTGADASPWTSASPLAASVYAGVRTRFGRAVSVDMEARRAAWGVWVGKDAGGRSRGLYYLHGCGHDEPLQ